MAFDTWLQGLGGNLSSAGVHNQHTGGGETPQNKPFSFLNDA